MAKIVLPKVVTSKDKPSLITNFLAALGLKHFATDAEPEEIMDAVNAMAEEKGAADEERKDPEKVTPPAKDVDPAIQALTDQVSKLTELVTALAQGEKKEVAPEDAIDAAIAELEKAGGKAAEDDDEEESHTISAEHMDEEGPVASPQDRPKPALTGDNGHMIAALRAIKPIIAAIPDPAQRKTAADAAIASIKGKPQSNTYAAIDKGRKKAADKAPAAVDQTQLGRDWAKQYNPHYKEKAKA